MAGDYSRDTFDPRQHFSAVRMQQGRVALDADWNEQDAIAFRRSRAQAVDALGRRAVPLETPNGFRVTVGLSGGTRVLNIGRGRLYLDGLLIENHGAATGSFDLGTQRQDRRGPVGVLAEGLGTASISYLQQLHWRSPDPLPASDGPHLVYLDVWQREVTHIEAPELLERALGGVDTTTRLQAVWQVRVLENIGTHVTCATPEDDIPNWTARTRPSAGRLTTSQAEGTDPEDPCLIVTAGGYRGLENQLYRVEVHTPGPPGTATFKWSRDNATVAASLVEIVAPKIVRVSSVGRDAILRFRPGDWVEVTDDRREQAQKPGTMRLIADVRDETRQITFTQDLPEDLLGAPDTLADLHARIRRWDQSRIVRDSAGNVIVDLGTAAATGTIPVPLAAATEVVLESGVRVSFSADPAGGSFRTGDHWIFAARSIDGFLESLVDAPPRGLHHHYAPLAIVRWPDLAIDQRTPLLPQTGNVHVCRVLYNDFDGRERALVPGQMIPVNELESGLVALSRQSLDKDSVNDASFFVTTEIPFRLPAAYGAAPSGPIVAYQPVVLPGETALIGDGVMEWRPVGQTVTFLRNIVQTDVPRLGNVRFEREFDVFDNGGPPSKWTLGSGNAVVQTNASAGTSPNPQARPMPTVAVATERLKDNPNYIGMTVETPLSGSVGIVYNWLDAKNFSLFIGSEVFVPVGFSGAMATLVMSHLIVEDGKEANRVDLNISSGFSDPRQISLDMKTTANGVQFGCRAVLSGTIVSDPALKFPKVDRLIAGSRVGVLTAGTGTARFTRLQVVYGDGPVATMIPAGSANKLLARLVVKRTLLQALGPQGVPLGGVFGGPVPEPDFETWFWLIPPVPGYYGYGYRGVAGFRGIGATRLLGVQPGRTP